MASILLMLSTMALAPTGGFRSTTNSATELWCKPCLLDTIGPDHLAVWGLTPNHDGSMAYYHTESSNLVLSELNLTSGKNRSIGHGWQSTPDVLSSYTVTQSPRGRDGVYYLGAGQQHGTTSVTFVDRATGAQKTIGSWPGEWYSKLATFYRNTANAAFFIDRQFPSTLNSMDLDSGAIKKGLYTFDKYFVATSLSVGSWAFDYWFGGPGYLYVSGMGRNGDEIHEFIVAQGQVVPAGLVYSGPKNSLPTLYNKNCIYGKFRGAADTIYTVGFNPKNSTGYLLTRIDTKAKKIVGSTVLSADIDFVFFGSPISADGDVFWYKNVTALGSSDGSKCCLYKQQVM